MDGAGDDDLITTIAALDALYGTVATASIAKEVDHLHPVYRPFIQAAPFAILATAGPGGLDATPRGDPAEFVHIEDDQTLLLPDRLAETLYRPLRPIA